MIVGMGAQALILRFWRDAAGALPRAFLWWVGKVLGLRVIVKGEIARAAPVLVVSNHVSWVDIVVLGGLAPLSFVAKSEVAGWPIIGTLARLQRSIFVDRTRRTMTADIARSIGHRLVAGDTIVLFGEGTTGDGNRVLPFRPALLASVREAMSASGAGGTPILVQPLSIVYSGLRRLAARARGPTFDRLVWGHVARLPSASPPGDRPSRRDACASGSRSRSPMAIARRSRSASVTRCVPWRRKSRTDEPHPARSCADLVTSLASRSESGPRVPASWCMTGRRPYAALARDDFAGPVSLRPESD